MKCAIVCRWATLPVKAFLRMSAEDYMDNYRRLKASLHAFYAKGMVYGADGRRLDAAALPAHINAAPKQKKQKEQQQWPEEEDMVGATKGFVQGKGKGKGKGEGKGQGAAKNGGGGKGGWGQQNWQVWTGERKRWCYNCYRRGHTSRECPTLRPARRTDVSPSGAVGAQVQCRSGSTGMQPSDARALHGRE